MSPTLLNYFSSIATLLASPGLPLPSTSLLCAIVHLLGALFKNMRLEWETQLLTCADEIWLLSTAEKQLLYCKQTQDERIRKKPLGSWSDIMLWQQLSVISAPCYNKQSCRSSLTNFRIHDQHGRTKGPLCSLAQHWHVHVLLYYFLVCCSIQTAIPLPCKLLCLNVLPSTLVNERFFFGEKGSSPVSFPWTGSNSLKSWY